METNTDYAYIRHIADFWTSKQRQGHSLHEISYRACFKPQLPEYFISRFTEPDDLVVDPFLGRGTTLIQSHLMNRKSAGSDINPLSAMLCRPRFNPPSEDMIANRLKEILSEEPDSYTESEDLLVFYHTETLQQLMKLKQWFSAREADKTLDATDDWIRMVCLNRLTGHSNGFFSVKTMPPNQAVSAESQRRINDKNGRTPEPKNAFDIVMKKTRSLMRSSNGHNISNNSHIPVLETTSADNLHYLADASVDLIVTSPPFLNIVDYKKDNWLRCWFADIDVDSFNIASFSSIQKWTDFIGGVFEEMCRVMKPEGRIAFEVGEVRRGTVKLEEEVIKATSDLPVILKSVLINQQNFTKTSNLWGVENNLDGTNTNRVLMFSIT